MRTSTSPAAQPGRRRHGHAPATPSALLLLSVLAVLFGGLLTAPEPAANPSSTFHVSAAVGTHAPTVVADPATTAVAGEHTATSSAPRPDRGERPDAVVAGAPLASWVHGLTSTLPDQAPTLGATAASGPLPGAIRHVHVADTDHHPSRAPPRA